MENSKLFKEAVIKEKICQYRLENANWTKEEGLFRNRWKLVRPQLRSAKIPLSLALKILYRRSIFKEYLDEFNYQQHQNTFLNKNKLAMTLYDQKEFTESDWQYFQENNDLFLMGNSMLHLKQAIEKLEIINIEYFQRKLTCIRLNNCFINELDNGLYDYKKLQIIHLDGNWITRIPGETLPRNLQILDLYANIIHAFDHGIMMLPKLSVLGLGKNCLHDGSHLHLLNEAQSLQCLISLDLSHNEICDLHQILSCINGLKHLKSLELEGNPCYVQPAYKNEIFKYLQQLLYLDNVEILEKDRDLITKNESIENEPALIFSCHRIIGLPAPPKQKGVLQTIHLEVTLPLLEEVIIPTEDLETDKPPISGLVADEAVAKKGKKGKKGTDKIKANNNKGKVKAEKGKGKGRKSKVSKSSTKKKGTGNLFYNASDEYENEVNARVVNRSFCTERVPWSKVIQFPQDTIVVKAPDTSNVIAIRDTFRTRVNVRLIYLKIQIPQKSKKSKSGSKKGLKKSKSKSKSGKASKGGVKKSKDENKNQSLPVVEDVDKAKEVILKKVTLANFNCSLYPVSWSDKTLDFYWADHEDCKTEAICVDGSLRAINYGDPKKKGNKKLPMSQAKATSKTGGPPHAKVIELLENEEQSFPKIFIMQVGFGLNRSYVV